MANDDRLIAIRFSSPAGSRLPQEVVDEIKTVSGDAEITPDKIWDTIDATTTGKNIVTATSPTSARDTIVAEAKHKIVQGADSATLAASASLANSQSKPLFIPAGTQTVPTGGLVIQYNSKTEGVGGNKTVLTPETGSHGIVMKGLTSQGGTVYSSQYCTLKDITVKYATHQKRSDIRSAGIYMPDGLQFSDVRNIYVNGGYHAVWSGQDYSSANMPTEFNNNWNTIRASDCWQAFCFELGSGTQHTNLYASNMGRSSVSTMLRCGDHNGYFSLLNLEWSLLRHNAIDLTVGHNMLFDAVHVEGLQFIGSGTTPLDGALGSSLISTSGQGITEFRNLNIDSCHWGGYMVTINGLTRTGSTARAKVNLMGWSTRTTIGHGIEVGDSVFISGSEQAEYNGAKIVTAIGTDWVEFAVTGTPVTPATVAAGSDCIVLNLGNQILDVASLVSCFGSVNRIVLNLHMRDIRVIAHTATIRQSMLRILNASTTPVRLDVPKISFGSQRPNCYWREPNKITGVSRTNNILTLHFLRPHRLNPGSVIHLSGFGTLVGRKFTVPQPIAGSQTNRFSMSFQDTDTNLGLTPTNGVALLELAAIDKISRSNNYATITTKTPHGLTANGAVDFVPAGDGLRAAIRVDQDNSFNTDDTLIQQVPSPTTFVVRSVGPDLETTTATGSLMVIEGGLTTGSFFAGIQPVNGVVDFDDLDEYQIVTVQSTLAPGATAVIRSRSVQSCERSRNTVQLLSVFNSDPRVFYSADIDYSNFVRINATNMSSTETVTIPPSLARVKVLR